MSERNYEAARAMDERYDDQEATLVAFRKFVTELGAVEEDDNFEESTVASMGDIETMFHALDELDQLRERVADLEAENEQLRERLDRLGDIGAKKTSKEQKIAAVVTYADNQRRPDQTAVTVTPRNIRGVADVSERYAYTLVDDMIDGDGEDGTVGPDGYDWAFDPREAPRRPDADTPDRGVGVDFEILQDDPAALSKFINASTDQGVAD